MDRLLQGIGVSPGVGFAPAMVVHWGFPEVPDRTVEEAEIDGEVRRLHGAVQEAVEGLEALRERVLQRAGVEESRIFEAQILMVQDSDFLAGVETLIRNNQLSAETAYEFKALELRNLWASSGSAQLRERLTDLTAIQRRVVLKLMGGSEREPWSGALDEQVIVVAHELSPGLTVQLDREHVVGLVSEEGTRTSHAAILAHSLGIPAVMGVTGALQRVRDGQMLLLDGRSGVVILDPTRNELDAAKTRLHRRHRLELKLEAGLTAPAVTPDGRTMTLRGNVDLPEEIEPAVRHGAQGVGLLRTEFLLTGRAVVPSESEQADYFRRVAQAFPGQPIVVRTFDLGGDKFPAAFDAPHEANPFLGWRSIRVCLDHPEIFRPQLRALLRAAVGRDLRIMLPLITRVEEVLQVRALLEEERATLERAGEPLPGRVPLGVMIETPAAVILADRLAAVSDFFSIGTNDLTQYTLVVDRGNARLAERFTTEHPAILRQLRTVQAAATAAGIPVSICGEMASEPLSAVLLMGLGFVELSVAPPALPLLKLVVRSVPAGVAEEAARRSLEAADASAVRDILRVAVGTHLDLGLIDPAGALPASNPAASFP
ncbi:MAG TPA: phosphoenolpyruvate--protein phosphotransferase [Gemmatimonadales bacterium]|jgi:phosphoenolpyruvate-protein phosphotransferase (PTS system enzyme I)|nr:phosphoenolpyruvate--protein phosphotransferase [Gemmatimonadales bacterium]